MFQAADIAAHLAETGITHVVSVPDTTIGPWLSKCASHGIDVVQVCREGEAWAVCGGLYLGGQWPLVLIQCTGMFESGDALRSMLHDWKLPLSAMIGYRSFLIQESASADTCLQFTEPILDAWNVGHVFLTEQTQLELAGEHLRACRTASRPGVVLFAEGKA